MEAPYTIPFTLPYRQTLNKVGIAKDSSLFVRTISNEEKSVKILQQIDHLKEPHLLFESHLDERHLANTHSTKRGATTFSMMTFTIAALSIMAYLRRSA
jgi:lipopolysaccharide export LptBFGC system permease protein LptF